MRLTIFSALVPTLLITVGLISCVDHNPLSPRVPASNLEEAKTLRAPFGDAKHAPPDIVAEGKRLYYDKGSCFYCHGTEGKGDGPAGAKLAHQPPADFSNCKLHEARTDGELYWALDNGVPGTAMVDMVHSGKLTEIEAWKIVAYLRTLCTFR